MLRSLVPPYDLRPSRSLSQQPPPGKLGNLRSNPPLKASNLFVHSPAKLQKRPEGCDYPAGGSFILQHHEPLLGSFTRHSKNAFLTLLRLPCHEPSLGNSLGAVISFGR